MSPKEVAMSIELQSKSTLVTYTTVRAIRFSRFFFFFFFFQRLRLLRGTALIVTRVNLHVDFTLCVWICRSWHLIILNIVKGNAMFNTRLNPMRPEAVGEKKNHPFILSNIWMKITHTAQTVATIALGRVFSMQLMYLRRIANSKEPKQKG